MTALYDLARRKRRMQRLSQTLSAEEIALIRSRCPSLDEPLTISPSLRACLEGWKRTDEQQEAREKRKYRNREESHENGS
jgi:hypothetical protein